LIFAFYFPLYLRSMRSASDTGDPEPTIDFLCPECGSRQFSKECFVETKPRPNDPWGNILQRYTCAQCGYNIPGYLAELWNGMTPEAAAK
jgi:predicted RNA-binding Zn-ribbon protein involved in translation (DUF1610 family)